MNDRNFVEALMTAFTEEETIQANHTLLGHDWSCYEKIGILEALPFAKEKRCHRCGRERPIVKKKDAEGKTRYFCHCKHCGDIPVSKDDLRWWRFHREPFIKILIEAFELEGTCTELLRNQVWYLGLRNGHKILLVRQAESGNFRTIIDIVGRYSDAVIMTFYYYAKERLEEILSNTIVSLHELTRIDESEKMSFDLQTFDSIVNAQTKEERTPEYQFAKKSGWIIRYKHRETVLAGETEGASYIQYLLKYPGQEIHVKDFLAELSGVPEVKAAFGNQEKVDVQTRANYESRLLEIADERKKAEADNNEALLEHLDEEVEAIGTQLLQTKDFCGKKATFSDDIKKIRRRISKKIKETLEMIRENDMTLFTHLDNAIDTGSILGYDPEEPIAWVFS